AGSPCPGARGGAQCLCRGLGPARLQPYGAAVWAAPRRPRPLRWQHSHVVVWPGRVGDPGRQPGQCLWRLAQWRADWLGGEPDAEWDAGSRQSPTGVLVQCSPVLWWHGGGLALAQGTSGGSPFCRAAQDSGVTGYYTEAVYRPERQPSTEESIPMKLDEIIKAASDLATPYRITEGDTFRLKDIDPDDTAGMEAADKLRAKEGLHSDVLALAELQDMLY